MKYIDYLSIEGFNPNAKTPEMELAHMWIRSRVSKEFWSILMILAHTVMPMTLKAIA